MITIMLRLSYLQNILIQHDIKILIEETMRLDADWFINFSKKNNEKIGNKNNNVKLKKNKHHTQKMYHMTLNS